MKKRIAGIDFGLKRIGVAISDERCLFSQPLKPILVEKTKEQTLRSLAAFLSSYNLSKIVIGLPLHLNGKDSSLSLEVRTFAKQLEVICQIPILLWDERLTSAQVERTLKEACVSRKKRTPIVDGMAAALILQNYLDSTMTF